MNSLATQRCPLLAPEEYVPDQTFLKVPDAKILPLLIFALVASFVLEFDIGKQDVLQACFEDGVSSECDPRRMSLRILKSQNGLVYLWACGLDNL